MAGGRERAVVHGGRWTLDDRLERGLRELPVEVPPGTASLTVRLSYDADPGVIDLGCAGPGGFRGWSGGARREFTIAPGWATPGYLPGELEPGLWHVWLGLHRIPVDGLAYEVTATTSTTVPPPPDAPARPPVPERPPRRDLPARSGMRWLAGDLHAHTVHSDGTLTVHELACLAASRGLDYLAVTDHNTVGHHPELPAAAAYSGVILVPGQEVTTDLGHANVFGPRSSALSVAADVAAGGSPGESVGESAAEKLGWIDFRCPAEEWVAGAAAYGSLISVNHPLSGDCAWRQPLPEAARPRLAEVWHSAWWDRRWGAPLAWARLWRPDVVPLGGSDYHDPAQHKLLGEPVTWVLAEDDDVLGGLAAGRTAVAAGRDAPVLLRVEDDLIAVGADGTVLVRPDGRREVVRGDHYRTAAKADGMHRLESYENEVIALCG
ncbi:MULTISPECIES: PHP domain-containing protein [Actinomadura]|uniref:PHP domain-containing protein n=1 Tax=Actinomadura yumaensis TaxID=111807 RepID=A0ABW2CCK8_9ACTN|nr:CehA/McbA family metallohydrolase [Actinomadura sp. J1-007]MWK38290.1 PHP domain-containing protein [Actinomadura sp. J1-007]